MSFENAPDGEPDEEAIVSVDERLAAYWRPVASLAKRARIPLIVFTAAFLAACIYSQVVHSRRIAWLNDLRRVGVLGSYETWSDRIGQFGSVSHELKNLVSGNRVTVHVEDPTQLKQLLSAPAFPGGQLTLMLPYEPSQVELNSIRTTFPKAALIVFSRATRTGRQVW